MTHLQIINAILARVRALLAANGFIVDTATERLPAAKIGARVAMGDFSKASNFAEKPQSNEGQVLVLLAIGGIQKPKNIEAKLAEAWTAIVDKITQDSLNAGINNAEAVNYPVIRQLDIDFTPGGPAGQPEITDAIVSINFRYRSN